MDLESAQLLLDLRSKMIADHFLSPSVRTTRALSAPRVGLSLDTEGKKILVRTSLFTNHRCSRNNLSQNQNIKQFRNLNDPFDSCQPTYSPIRTSSTCGAVSRRKNSWKKFLQNWQKAVFFNLFTKRNHLKY